MIWLVWAASELESDAQRIDAQDCLKAAEEWARRNGVADPMCRRTLDIHVRAASDEVIVYQVWVEIQAVIQYRGKLVGRLPSKKAAICHHRRERRTVTQ